VWLLEIRLAGPEDVQPDAEIGRGDELQVRSARRLAFRGHLGKLEGIHSPSLAAREPFQAVDRTMGR
jgi:hypothetical protein